MTYEEFINRKTRIDDWLDRIAKRTEQLALKGEANSENDEFMKIMCLHQHYCEKVETLIDQYEQSESNS
jgi:hypothetical protein